MGMIEVVGQRPKIAKRTPFLVDWNMFSALEYLERSKWGCLEILGSVTTLPPSNCVTQESCGNYNTHYTKKQMADYNLRCTVGAVR